VLSRGLQERPALAPRGHGGIRHSCRGPWRLALSRRRRDRAAMAAGSRHGRLVDLLFARLIDVMPSIRP
jgi:hypothetical protein